MTEKRILELATENSEGYDALIEHAIQVGESSLVERLTKLREDSKQIVKVLQEIEGGREC